MVSVYIMANHAAKGGRHVNDNQQYYQRLHIEESVEQPGSNIQQHSTGC